MTEPAASPTTGPQGPTVTALSVTDDISVGPNRFTFVLLDAENLSIGDAAVRARFYRITDAGAQLAFEADAEHHNVQDWFPHLHPGGGTHFHAETSSYYALAKASFDTAGRWGAEFIVNRAGGPQMTVAGPAFEVRETGSTPALGQPVPATDNPTLQDVADIGEIDSSDPPRPELHSISVAEALAAGKPFVVTFSSPSFCQSRLCGPVTDIVASLQTVYGDRVNFIHIEPYDMTLLRSQGQYQLTTASQEWGLPSEPWTFVVDASGRLAAKFGGVLSPEELEAAVASLLA